MRLKKFGALLALRNVLGQEYAGARAFRDMWHIPMDFALGGAQHLRLMNQLEEWGPGARQREPVGPLAPGPRECLYYCLLVGVSPLESRRLFSEFTASLRCFEKAWLQLEKTADPAGHPSTCAASRDSLLSLVDPACEAPVLFAVRIWL